MIRASRRQVLQSMAALGGVLGVEGPARAAAGPGPALVIHDSALPASAMVAALHPLADRLDLARERRSRWQALRGHDGRAARIDGLTRWSDWVMLRGELQRQGYRVAHERPGAVGPLCHWSMTRRA